MNIVQDITTAVSAQSQKDSSPSGQTFLDFKLRCMETIRKYAAYALCDHLPGEDPDQEYLRVQLVNINPPYLTDNAKVILEKRYLLKDPITKEVIETPVQMFGRVALKLALIEIDYEIQLKCSKFSDEELRDVVDTVMGHFRDFYNVMHQGLFIPAGRTLANEGSSVPNWYLLLKILDQDFFANPLI